MAMSESLKLRQVKGNILEVFHKCIHWSMLLKLKQAYCCTVDALFFMQVRGHCICSVVFDLSLLQGYGVLQKSFLFIEEQDL